MSVVCPTAFLLTFSISFHLYCTHAFPSLSPRCPFLSISSFPLLQACMPHMALSFHTRSSAPIAGASFLRFCVDRLTSHASSGYWGPHQL